MSTSILVTWSVWWQLATTRRNPGWCSCLVSRAFYSKCTISQRKDEAELWGWCMASSFLDFLWTCPQLTSKKSVLLESPNFNYCRLICIYCNNLICICWMFFLIYCFDHAKFAIMDMWHILFGRVRGSGEKSTSRYIAWSGRDMMITMMNYMMNYDDMWGGRSQNPWCIYVLGLPLAYVYV